MSDRDTTKLLTKIGFLWLKYLGCHLVAPEVSVLYHGLRDFTNGLDQHRYIDLVGISHKYIPENKRKKDIVEYISYKGERRFHETVIDKETTSRGIEIKVSRSDFKNGFIHVGCDYHYLLIPKGLVDKKEVTKGIGIIEVDLEKLRLNKRKHQGYASYWLEGVEQVRKPRRKTVNPAANEFMIKQMAYTLTGLTKQRLQEELALAV